MSNYMPRIHKLLSWLDEHLLEILAGVLIAFIPLYPKWPLFDVLPGYIVRVRLEDFVIAFTDIVFIVQLLRRKATLRDNPLFKPILIYLIIGFLSSLSAIFITKTVPMEIPHMGKLFLHWARRVEYMSLAFIFYSAIRSKKSLKRLIIIFLFSAVLVSLYGYGQKYLSWPVYSTMNREFAKGWRLVLTEFARVNSTFAGHYDLAAFTVIVLPLLAALIVIYKKMRFKAVLWISYILTLGTLLLTASRTSFVAYVVAINAVFVLLFNKKNLKRIALYWATFMTISVIGFFFFGSLYSRFAHILRLDRVQALIQENIIAKIEPHLNKPAETPKPNDLNLVYTETDTPPSIADNNNKGLPPDVFTAIPQNLPEASLSGIPATAGTGLEGKPRDYSDAAFKYGLSSAIRIDALWPRAMQGFKTNPFFGTGYSTLTKVQNTEFTEAESTDNDYLRTLGETGGLGVLSFFGIFVFALFTLYKTLPKAKSSMSRSIYIGFMAALVGLLINALYIDIFESSKVAYMVWAFMGIVFGLVHLLTTRTYDQNR